MDDAGFLKVVFRYAEAKNDGPLTKTQRDEIIAEFNRATGGAEKRALEAIRNVLKLNVLLEDLRKSANLDNTQRLLQDLQSAAAQWQATAKK